MLIKCPECGKEISDKAKNCPNCGCSINVNIKYKIVINNFFDTDTAALAGLDEILGITYEEGVEILNNLPNVVGEYETLYEASKYAKPLMSAQWGLDITVLLPDDSVASAESLTNHFSNRITCPTCKAINITRISASSKIASTLLFGLYGNKRKKTFHCNNCGYDW